MISLPLDEQIWKTYVSRFNTEDQAREELCLYIRQQAHDDESLFLEILCRKELVARWQLKYGFKLDRFIFDPYRKLYIYKNETWTALPRNIFPTIYKKHLELRNCTYLKLFGRIS